MKRSYILGIAAAALALMAYGCEKTTKVGLNDANKKYFDAWRMINYPEAKRVDPGIYVISESAGTGASAGDPEVNQYIRLNLTKTDLKGNISESTYEKVNQQLGEYTRGDYYGPVIWYRGNNSLTAGLEAAVSDMKVGGIKQVIIPGWLGAYDRYDSEEEYLEKSSGTAAIYTLELKDVITDVVKWELDSLERFAKAKLNGVDSTKYGFYYMRTREPDDPNSSFTSSEKVYINYTGRLLNGQVFDTTVKDTAKVWGLYSSSSSYSPTYVTWKDDYKDFILGTGTSANMIDGFAYCVSLMKKGEKGICAFYSNLGYGVTGSSTRIPGYCPIAFEIEVLGTNLK